MSSTITNVLYWLTHAHLAKTIVRVGKFHFSVIVNVQEAVLLVCVFRFTRKEYFCHLIILTMIIITIAITGYFLCNHERTTSRFIDGLVQDCSISSALAMEILQSCTKPSTCDAL